MQRIKDSRKSKGNLFSGCKRTISIMVFFFVFGFLSGCKTDAETTEPDIPLPVLEIKQVPDIQYFYMDVKGSFQQHPALISEIQEYLGSQGIETGNCIGIYFEDPDAVPESELDWQIGFEIYKSPDNLNPEGKYKTRTLEETGALVVQSNVEYMPSRTIYHLDHENPLKTSTTIVYPVTKRKRDIPVLSGSTLNHTL